MIPQPMPQKAEECVEAFPITSVPHGQSVQLRVTHSQVFRATRLVVDPLCAPFYNVKSIVAGREELFRLPLSATLFPPLPLNYQELKPDERKIVDEYVNKIRFPTMQPGQTTSMWIEHRTECPWHSDCSALGIQCSGRPFSGFLQGHSLSGL